MAGPNPQEPTERAGPHSARNAADERRFRRSDPGPVGRHGRVLEALDHRIEIARAAIDAGERDRWMVRHVEPYTDALLLSFTGEPDGEGDAFCVGTLDVQENFWRLIEANDPKTTLAQLEGRRRILQRHAPVQAVDADVALCARCSGYSPVAWPCPDWLDAASGLENTE